MPGVVEPIATYRFQLTPEFGFDAVVDRLDHVRRLGASHVYLSPIAQAVPSSTHGYDVVDHTRVRAEFGGASRFERLLDEANARRMAVLIDHVPNHVAASAPHLNPTWWAVLRDGRGSPADDWYDIDWDAADDRVILPVLDDELEAVVAAGEIVVDGDALVVHGARRLPLAPGSSQLPLADLLEAQHYRLQHWRRPDRNVRRFFTIDDLVGVCVEHEHVAAVVDTLPARYATHPGFGGVRIDHIDGLADPVGYLRGLRSRLGDDPLVFVEKIVVPGESIPASWPVDGTTGYEFMRTVDQLLIAAEARPVFDRLWTEWSGDVREFEEWEIEARGEVLDDALAPDLGRLADLARTAVEGDAGAISAELRSLTGELPRYRTYLPDDPAAADLIGEISSGPVARALLDPADAAQIELRTRWQQLTGPVMAKGAEDRSFYRYLRFASLCEVGGSPGTFGIEVSAFHADNLARQHRRPRTMLASSTHDTKRSEGVRARAAALTWRAAHDPDRITDLLLRWVDELVAATGVDAVTAWLAAQTAVSTAHIDAPRLHDYLVKATREASIHTSWESPDDGYEARLTDLARVAVDTSPGPELALDAIAPGMSLAATTLRLTSPGIPDLYQGSEAFTYRLVDPDNRVPPDWDQLDDAARGERTVAELWAANDPTVKTALVRDVLGLRRRRSASFGPGGSYMPIDVGTGAVAFARGGDVVVAVRRGAAGVTGRLTFPPGTWYDVLDPPAPTLSGTVDTAAVIGTGDEQTLPVAVFERD